MRWSGWVLLVGVGCTGGGGTTDKDSGATHSGSSHTATHTGATTAPPTEDEVRAAIDAANYCTDASDCVDLGEQCPFGCWILVNTAEADAVQALIDAWIAGGGSTCTYSCFSHGPLSCTGGSCVADTGY